MPDTTHSTLEVCDQFFKPVFDLINDCDTTRKCPELADAHWVELGLRRVLSEAKSSRGFLQDSQVRGQATPANSHFFETLKSQRRLKFCEQLNAQLCISVRHQLPDALADLPGLDKFEVRAGDGHWHGAATHDIKHLNNKCERVNYAAGHLYTLDLRTHVMRHLMAADGLNKRKEHDMPAIKRAGAEKLREGVAKGRKLLMVWDSAAVDFGYWYKLKQGHGIYFLTRDKDNHRLLPCGERNWDRDDPLNRGVISDAQFAPSTNSAMVRVIEFVDKATGKIHRFLTNEMTLAPGVLAQLYRMRWDIEKVFDEVKNHLNEKKAWARSPTAKSMQGQFIAMTHNLMLLLERDLESTHGIVNEPDRRRRIDRRKEELDKSGYTSELVALGEWLRRCTQRGLKFIRWLRVQLSAPTSYSQALDSLRTLYAKL